MTVYCICRERRVSQNVRIDVMRGEGSHRRRNIISQIYLDQHPARAAVAAVWNINNFSAKRLRRLLSSKTPRKYPAPTTLGMPEVR